MVRILCDRSSASLLLTFGLTMAAPMTMLSNVAFLLEDHHGMPTAQASLLIGSIPVMMILASAAVSLLARSTAPSAVLRTSMMLQALIVGLGLTVGCLGAESLEATMATCRRAS